MTSQPQRTSTPAAGCKATKEELLKAGKTVIDVGPICLDENILCRVGCHPSVTGKIKFQ